MRGPAVSAVFVLVLAACPGSGEGLDENGNPIGPPRPPADSLTLSGDVQPILTANCALSGCHAGSQPVSNQNLSAGLTYGSTVNVPSQQVPTLRRVRPFLPDSSYLVHKIQGTHASVGGSGGRMPLGGPPLSSAEIQTIRTWIAAGAPNN